MNFKSSFVIVMPIYEDLSASRMLFNEISLVFGDLAYIVAVDDGSLKHVVNASDIEDYGLSGVVIRLKRNVGHQRAIAIGLNHVAKNIDNIDYIVVMDSDGEDSPVSIKNLLETIEGDSDMDVIVSQRKSRVETIRFKVFYAIYKRIFNLFTGHSITFGNFMILRLSAVKRLVTMSELWIHLAGCVLVSKLRLGYCSIDRSPRYSGKSKMRFVDLALHGFRGVMVFSENVLVRVGMVCTVVALLSIVGVFAAMILKVIGYATPGWFSDSLGILLLVFLQTGALTLMTLMLTGVVKSGTLTAMSHDILIESLYYTRANKKITNE